MLLKSLELAKANHLTVSFDLASFEIVNQFKTDLKEILKNHIDMVFANEDEASAFTQLPPSQSEESLKVLSELCETAVVKRGAKGTLIAKDNEISVLRQLP